MQLGGAMTLPLHYRLVSSGDPPPFSSSSFWFTFGNGQLADVSSVVQMDEVSAFVLAILGCLDVVRMLFLFWKLL